MGTESEMIMLSGHVGHERRSRLVLNYRITVSGSPNLILIVCDGRADYWRAV